ncbi:DUF6343 family protein [Streptomyces iconiensis]|uniref:DUF6343 family protein n=1 Tax=Streptomyces iconiensis TaxID=1384038 RepID=A0ABT6ZYX3_9ACTN|nr:DUF6343 family protein [Streptomyces iconiensis]MDJ1134267.1 DUF6343 family protein [Streptomyces iconiensis]
MSEPQPPRPRAGHRDGSRGGRHARSGTEPVTARTDLRLRAILSSCGVPVFAAAAVFFAWWASTSHSHSSPSDTLLSVLAGVCALLALFAAIDLVVIRRRARERRARSRP